MPDALHKFLTRAELFKDAPEEIRREIEAKCVRQKFTKGTVLFQRGALDRTLYLIESGRVRIYLPGESGRDVTLNVCGSGEAIGELSLLDAHPRSASAQALDDVTAYTLGAEEFSKLLGLSPLATSVLRVLCVRLRHATVATESLALFDVFGRLAQCLLDLATRHGSGREIDLELSQTELASLVGATRETVNRALTAFRHQGLIEQHGHKIVILEPDLLRRRIQ